MSIGEFVTRDVHVWSTTREVIRHVRRKLTKKGRSRARRAGRHQLYRDALVAHRRHQELVAQFRL